MNGDHERRTPCAEAERPEDGAAPELSDDEKIDMTARRLLERYRAAFLELAK